VFWPLKSNSEFSGVPKDSQVPISGVWVSSSHSFEVGLRHKNICLNVLKHDHLIMLYFDPIVTRTLGWRWRWSSLLWWSCNIHYKPWITFDENLEPESFDKSILCMTIMAMNVNHHMVTIVVLEVLNALKMCFLETKKIIFMNLNFSHMWRHLTFFWLY
jgi:hypothetical protein